VEPEAEGETKARRRQTLGNDLFISPAALIHHAARWH
jgi:hypothetical protein